MSTCVWQWKDWRRSWEEQWWLTWMVIPKTILFSGKPYKRKETLLGAQSVCNIRAGHFTVSGHGALVTSRGFYFGNILYGGVYRDDLKVAQSWMLLCRSVATSTGCMGVGSTTPGSTVINVNAGLVSCTQAWSTASTDVMIIPVGFQGGETCWTLLMPFVHAEAKTDDTFSLESNLTTRSRPFPLYLYGLPWRFYPINPSCLHAALARMDEIRED